MTKRTRAWILYFLVLIFLVVGAGAILYAEGWRAQLHPLAFAKVGGLYVRTLPDDAKIFLDGKQAKKAAHLFDRGTLVSGLFPETYNLRVEREGYQSWNETLPVAASLVTSRAHIVLAPAAGSAVTSTPTTEVTVLEGALLFSTADGRIFKDSVAIPGSRLVAATQSGRIILTASGTANYFLTDTAAGTTTPLTRIVPRLNLAARATTTFTAVPESDSLFLVQSPALLQLVNVTNGQITSLESTSTTAVGMTAARIAWTTYDAATGHSVISLYDLLSGTFLRGVDFVPGRVTKIVFADRDTVFVLAIESVSPPPVAARPAATATASAKAANQTAAGGETFYQVDLAAGSRVKLAGGVYDFALAPDGGLAAFLDARGLNIFESRGGKRSLFFAIPNPQTVTRMAWYADRAHVILNYPDAIDFLAFEDATLKNMATIARSGTFTYDSSKNILYTLPGGILTKFEFPR